MDKRRKRKSAEMFSLDSLEKRFSARKAFREELGSKIAFLRGIDLSTVDVDEEEAALLILASKITFQGVIFLKAAIQHVPQTYLMKCTDSGGASLRSVIIYQLTSASQTSLSSLSKEEVDCYVNFIENNCANFLGSTPLPKGQLWDMCQGGKFNFPKFLAPPVSACLRCERKITMHNPPTKAKVFTLEGPIPATKIMLECRPCKISYGIARYTLDGGSHYYPKELSVDLIEVSNATYICGQLYKWLPSLSNHSWVSFSGFSESYNEVYQDEIERYRKTVKACDVESEPDESSEAVEGCPTDEVNTVSTGELSAKIAAKSYWKRELEEELDELKLREDWTFTKTSTEAQNHTGCEEQAMEYIESTRSEQLYSHNCSKKCQDKGCGQLYVADGNWKLRYAHCMWKVPVTVPGFGEAKYPNICPLSPKRGHAFCEKHCQMAVAAGCPSELRQFLKKCGVPDADKFTELEATASRNLQQDASGSDIIGSVEETLNACAKSSQPSDLNASSYQGTAEFLQSHPEFIDSDEQERQVDCNKDTGGRKTLHCWSRGIFFIVSSGGHIDYWQPLYRSESPTQAYLILATWLYRKFKALQDAGQSTADIKRAMGSTILAYDNMCHVDTLKISKKDLPFPAPFDKVWSIITKVIDRLHLKNHKDPRCKQLYNAEDKIPSEFNTMACEQTFIWASRLKKIACAMARLHQFFFLHRSVKRRNRYTELCYAKNKNPVLPKLSVH